MADSKKADSEELEDLSLETSSTIDNPDALSVQSQTNSPNQQLAYKQSFSDRLANMAHKVNIYLIAFIAIVIIAVIVIWVARSNSDDTNTNTISNQNLSEETLNELLQSESSVGDVNKTLTVEANAIFNGRILVKDNLDVAGSINVGGPLTLPGITVAGTSAFDEVEVNNNLSILGNASLQGSLSVQSGLSVSGNASFNGSISAESIVTDNLEFRGDLAIQGHIDTGGPSPTASSGGSIGIGGTASVSGTDSSGTVTINTGSGPGAGTLANITFAKAYNGTPHIVITPVGAPGANIEYYITRTTSGFTIRSDSTPNSSTTYVFDYWVAE